jgi:hypothetical protein
MNGVRLRIQIILEKTMTLVEIFQLMKEMKFCLTASLALPWEWPSWIEGLEMECLLLSQIPQADVV